MNNKHCQEFEKWAKQPFTGLLYNLDLLPEQLKEGTRDWLIYSLLEHQQRLIDAQLENRNDELASMYATLLKDATRKAEALKVAEEALSSIDLNSEDRFSVQTAYKALKHIKKIKEEEKNISEFSQDEAMWLAEQACRYKDAFEWLARMGNKLLMNQAEQYCVFTPEYKPISASATPLDAVEMAMKQTK